ncbi:MAG: hypothetical protein Q9173_006894 [Seirophora scorigena]
MADQDDESPKIELPQTAPVGNDSSEASLRAFGGDPESASQSNNSDWPGAYPEFIKIGMTDPHAQGDHVDGKSYVG